jgi:hypothetical protein
MEDEGKKPPAGHKKVRRRGGDFASDNVAAAPLPDAGQSDAGLEEVTIHASEALGMQAIVDALYGQVKDRIILKDVKPSNVMIMLTYGMTAVEKQKGLTGPEKKEVVVHLVRRLVGEIPGDDEDKVALQAAVELLLPPLIDTLVAASRGKLDLNKDGVVTADEVSQTTASCWRMCFPCCFPAPPAP